MDKGIVEKVRGLMRDKPIFIADGHHATKTRSTIATACRPRKKLAGPDAPENFVMMMFVGMSDPGFGHHADAPVGFGYRRDHGGRTQGRARRTFRGRIGRDGCRRAKSAWEMVEADGGQDVFGFGDDKDGAWSFARVTDASPMKSLARSRPGPTRGAALE